MFLPSRKLYRFSMLLLMPNMLSALPDDRLQAINIDSDKFVQKTLESGGDKIEYIGNVVVIQGTLHITGERVTVFRKDHSITKIVAAGNPAHFQQQPALNKEPIRAQANDIQYILKNDALLLAGNATIFQQGSIISSDKINYNIAAESVAASSSDSETSRVKMVLEPSRVDISKDDDTQHIESALPGSIASPAKDKP